MRLAVLTDMHVCPVETADGTWNNPTRYSRSRDLLFEAAEAVRRENIDHVVVLGDISNDGDQGSVVDALVTLTRLGRRVWAVPGNHDVMAQPCTVLAAAEVVPGANALSSSPVVLDGDLSIAGVELESADEGRTCTATNLPDRVPNDPGLLVWASHYPVLSVQGPMRARSLRYPGDLINRSEMERAIAERSRPTLVLHGHVHAAIGATRAQMLQIGCAPLVEWPHAWTLLDIDRAPMGWVVRAERRPVVDDEAAVDTTFSAAVCAWTFADRSWRETEATVLAV